MEPAVFLICVADFTTTAASEKQRKQKDLSGHWIQSLFLAGNQSKSISYQTLP